MSYTTYTDSTISTCKEPFAIKSGTTWYAFPKKCVDASLGDYKLWAQGSGRSMTGDNKGTLVGIFPKIELKIGRQRAEDRALMTRLLNQQSTTVRAYCTEREQFETASFYFGDVVNKIKKWDSHGTFANGKYKSNTLFDTLSISVISNNRRS